jgi:hypothetical protein
MPQRLGTCSSGIPPPGMIGRLRRPLAEGLHRFFSQFMGVFRASWRKACKKLK